MVTVTCLCTLYDVHVNLKSVISSITDKPLLTAGAIVGTGTVVLVIVVAALTVMILILWCKRLRAKQKRAALKSSYM